MDNNSYFIIHRWMISELHLKGAELQVYAIIYGFSKNNAGVFTGGNKYLEELLEAPERTIIRATNNLKDKNLITEIKATKNSRKAYKIVEQPNKMSGDKMSGDKMSGDKMSGQDLTKCQVTPDKMSGTHNIINNNINNNIEKEKVKKEKTQKNELEEPSKLCAKSSGFAIDEPAALEKENKNSSKKQTENINDFKNQIKVYTANETLQAALLEFVYMRRKIKKPLTLYAFKLVTNKLDKLGQTDAEKVKILNQSIENSWQGIFPLKEQKANIPEESQQDYTPKYGRTL